MNNNDIFTTRLREIIRLRGTNQTKLQAQILEETGEYIQRQTISQYVGGRTLPNASKLAAICKTLDVSADYLLGLRSVNVPLTDEKNRYLGDLSSLILRSSQELMLNVSELSDLLNNSAGRISEFGGNVNA